MVEIPLILLTLCATCSIIKTVKGGKQKMNKLTQTKIYVEDARRRKYVGASKYFRYNDLLERATYKPTSYEEFTQSLESIIDSYYITSLVNVEYQPNIKIIVENVPLNTGLITWGYSEIMEKLLEEEKNAFNLSKGLISVDRNKYRKAKEEEKRKFMEKYESR